MTKVVANEDGTLSVSGGSSEPPAPELYDLTDTMKAISVVVPKGYELDQVKTFEQAAITHPDGTVYDAAGNGERLWRIRFKKK